MDLFSGTILNMKLDVLQRLNDTLLEVADRDLQERLGVLVVELLDTALTPSRKREMGKYMEKLVDSGQIE